MGTLNDSINLPLLPKIKPDFEIFDIYHPSKYFPKAKMLIGKGGWREEKTFFLYM